MILANIWILTFLLSWTKLEILLEYLLKLILDIKVGGIKTSSHTNIPCNAADISTIDSVTRFKVLQALLEVGFVRIGIGESFIHCDTDTENKSPEVCWTYY